MTPLRTKEKLLQELLGVEQLLSITPEDPIATPLIQSRIANLKEQIEQTQTSLAATPETEIFFGEGPVIGSQGIAVTFASNVLATFQKMVTNHFAARFRGGLKSTGKRKGEAESVLYLTALPQGSFGLQISRPIHSDLFNAKELSTSMEEITALVTASAKSDLSFVEAIPHFNSRVLIPLQDFLETLSTAGADCRMISGNQEARLKREEVTEAFERVKSRKVDSDKKLLTGIFLGALAGSGKFEFDPDGEPRLTGYLSEDIKEEQAVNWDRNFTGQRCEALIIWTRVTTQTGKQSYSYELQNLSLIKEIPEKSSPQ